jgi:inner membrane protein YidH
VTSSGYDDVTDRGRQPPPLREAGRTPDYRFTLANERTFLAWIRTALAILAAGVAVVELAPEFGLSVGRHLVGVALLALGTTVASGAYGHWRRNERAMRLEQELHDSWIARLLGPALTIIALSALTLGIVSALRK